MNSVIKYSAINTKIRALEGEMLKDFQYAKLMESRTYKEAISYLKEETSYNKAFQGYNIEQINRGFLEFILKRYSINRITKLSNYFVGEYKRFFRIFLMRFEIEDLKVIIRGKYIGKSNEEIKDHLIYVGALNYADYDKLLNCKSVQEVVEKLNGTPYYKHLAPVVSSIKEEGLFRLEMVLDFIYFSSIRKYIGKIAKQDREEVEKIIGIQSDLLNIQWIFRGKRYYNLSPEVLFSYSIYDGYKLNSLRLKKLCYAKDLDEFYNMLKIFPYKDIFIEHSDEHLIEKKIIAYLKGLSEKYKRENKLNISFMMSYIELMIIEMRNIISIVENKRYNIHIDEALKYVSISY